MTQVRSLYHLIRADFLERVRRISFLVVLGLTVYAGYAMVPSGNASYNAFVIGGQRGIYNSAWVGTIFGVITSTLLAIIGFYLIRNAVNRDYETRVGQIIAATPIKKPVYLLGKWLSNLAVLSSILIVLTMMALAMKLIRAEDPSLDLWALVAPIWFIGFPALAVVSSIAVLFETLPLLRSGIGQAIYFMLVCWYIAQPFLSSDTLTPVNDFSGVSRTLVDIRELLESNGYDITQGTTDLFEPTGGRQTVLFAWNGLNWSAAIVFERLLWLGLAAGMVLVAVLPFDRFDPARRFRRGRKRKEKPDKKQIPEKQVLLTAGGTHRIPPAGMDVKLTPLDTSHTHRQFSTPVFTEFRLLAHGRQWWWYGMVLGLFVAALASPMDVCHRWLFPAAWIWPVFLWSGMGNQESRFHTNRIVFSVDHLVRRQLPSAWLAGVLVSLTCTGGAGVRVLCSGQWNSLGGWIAACLFVPSLALACGVWTNGRRLFEMIYFILWYAGCFKAVSVLNYTGSTELALQAGTPAIYTGLACILCIMSFAGRSRQIHT